jgi:hypothetical protein
MRRFGMTRNHFEGRTVMTSSTTLPRRNPPKVTKRSMSDRIVAGIVFFGLGFFARLWLVGLWIFSDLLGDAFEGWVIPVLGFFLLPWTTLTYAFMWAIGSDKASGWEWIPVGIALLVDLVFWAWSRSAFK